MKRTIFSLCLFGLAAALLTHSAVSSAPAKAPGTALVVDTSGQEEPEVDAIFLNGFNVANRDQIRFKDFYEQHADWLGEPIGPFTGASQAFRFCQLTFNLSNPPEWRTELSNCGEADMRLEGFTPQPAGSASAHPALRDYLVDLYQRGVDVPRLVGPIISEPRCQAKTKLCTQWTMKARFEFPASAASGDAVRRLPIGLWLTHPRLRPAPAGEQPDEAPSSGPPPGLSIGLVLGLIACLLLVRPKRQGIRSLPL
jgi:hypothetical protein